MSRPAGPSGERGLLKTYWYTDRGRRASNEDAVVVESLPGDRELVAVADGMGGHAGGEVASTRALEVVIESLQADSDLVGAFKNANAALLEAADLNPEWRGMGTTLLALLRVGREYFVANVGDSRAYRLDSEGLRRITEDHSFTAEAINSGRLSEDEAERSPWRNALTRAVGTDADVEVDLFGPFPVDPPHLVVLCTDGLYRVMHDKELGTELQARANRADRARELVADAVRRGSNDNISVAMVELGSAESRVARVASAPPGESASPTETASEGGPSTGTRRRWEIGEAEPDPGGAAPPPENPGASPGEAVGVAAPGGEGGSPGGAPGGGAAPSAPGAAAPRYRPPPHRSARRARPSGRRRRRKRPLKLPSWFQREIIPAFVLIVLTVVVVYVISGIIS